MPAKAESQAACPTGAVAKRRGLSETGTKKDWISPVFFRTPKRGILEPLAGGN